MFELEINLTPAIENLEKDLRRDVEDLSESVVKRTVRQMPVEMRRSMADSPPAGRQYAERSGAGFQRFHTASAKGNPPRNRTFALSNSFEGKMTGKAIGEVAMLDYARYLDPFLGGGLNRPFIEQAAADALEKAVNQL